jgi:hypothetical protein
MPLEIRELVFELTVGKAQAAENGAATNGQAKIGDEEMELIIEKCIERMLEILNDKTDR